MPAVQSVAIIGAGAAGAASAILLAEAGVRVDVFDSKDEIGALGSGITIQGNACRVFDQLGVWPEVEAASYGFDVLSLRAPDPDGTVLVTLPDAKTGGPDYPATIGMYRPDMAAILLRRAEAVGATIHWGAALEAVEMADDGVEITVLTADGATTGRYDLLIGADGLHSATRRLIGIDIQPRRTGMGIWRAFVPRPADVTHTSLYYGGPSYIAGYCPTGEDTMYAYIVEKAQDRGNLLPSEGVEIMRQLAEAYHGPWDEIRESLDSASRVNYTWFTEHIIDGPWNRGRAVLIGDAAHSCPPTIAQGAAMALEDASVLSELLIARDAVDDALWSEFSARRLPRAKKVVEASVQLGDWLLAGDQHADVPGLMYGIATLVSQPA